jgi:hypothetical protein
MEGTPLMGNSAKDVAHRLRIPRRAIGRDPFEDHVAIVSGDFRKKLYFFRWLTLG